MSTFLERHRQAMEAIALFPRKSCPICGCLRVVEAAYLDHEGKERDWPSDKGTWPAQNAQES